MNSIKQTPYNTATFKPGSGGVHPSAGYRYLSPEGTLWNVDAIEGDTVKLWTVNAWGQTHRQSVNRYEFERTWKERTA